MCNRILETRGSFRAFYIVLLMLQQMQKLNGNRKIKDLKVWTQELVHLVKQKLVEWSNFPEAMVLELLECYDVSLQRGWTFPWRRTEEKYDDPKFGN